MKKTLYQELKRQITLDGYESFFDTFLLEMNLNYEHKGICAKTKTGEPLLLVISRLYCDEKLDEKNKGKITSIFKNVCGQFMYEPYTDKPDKNNSPVLSWMLEYINSPIFPFGFIRVQQNLGLILSHLIKEGHKVTRKDLTPLTSVVKRYIFSLNPERARVFSSIQNDEVLRSEIEAIVDFHCFTGKVNYLPSTIHTHKCDIFRLFCLDKTKKIGKRKGSSRKNIPTNNPFDVDDDSVIEENNKPDADELDLTTEINSFAEKPNYDDKYAQYVNSKNQKDPYLLAIQRQFCSTTPGVLSEAEIIILLSVLDEFIKKDHFAGLIVKTIIVAALGYGWSKDKIYSLIADPGSQIIQIGNLICYQMKAMIPVGWPKNLQRELNSESNSFFYNYYVKSFERPTNNYLLPLHPILSEPVHELILTKHVISPDEITNIFNLFTDQLKRTYFSIKLSIARMNLSFQGWGSSKGLDTPDRYVISGRIYSSQVMPVNYTRVKIKETINKHWSFINFGIDKFTTQKFCDNRIKPVSWLLSSPLPNLQKIPDQYAGSWSIPKAENVKNILMYLKGQMNNSILPWHIRCNSKLLFLSLVIMPTTLMRPFEFEEIKPCNGYVLGGDSIGVKVKGKQGQERFTLKYIPDFLQTLFWECYEECFRDYSSGSFWCTRDENGVRGYFNIQIQINLLQEQMGLTDVFIRAYGFRHLGRTLHRDAGFSEYFINYKMHHEFSGSEKFNPGSSGYRSFIEANNKVMEIIGKKSGLL